MRNPLPGRSDARLVWLLAVSLAVVCSCGSDRPDPGIDPAPVPVTVTFLRHDSSTYLQADEVFFAEFKAAHPNITIVANTVDQPWPKF